MASEITNRFGVVLREQRKKTHLAGHQLYQAVVSESSLV